MLPPLPTSSLTPEETATAVIRAYCGWHVAPVITETLTLDGNGTDRLALPSMRVESVDEVRIDGVAVTGFRWSADGWLTRKGGVWPDVERSIEVDLRHGFDFAPEVHQVAAALAARAELDITGIHAEEAVGPFRDRYVVSGGEVRTVGMLISERELLARYRLFGVSRV